MKRILFRASTLKERREFYEKEFSIGQVKNWFRGRKLPQICAIDAGTDTGVIEDKKLKGYLLYFKFNELKEKIKEYNPEDIYYDRSVYKDPNEFLKNLKFEHVKKQELAFDIDAENIPCNHSKKSLVCEKCLAKAYRATMKMYEELSCQFKKIKIIYSGKGFHIHVFDKKAMNMNFEERARISEKFAKKYPIDVWVSKERIRLIRMPYSLNATVSRKVMPVNKKFNEKKSWPRFLIN